MTLRAVKIVLFFVILALGIATIVVTLANGGGVGSRGILFGGVLCAMALLRIYITFRHEA